jgi:xylulokinase
LGRDIYASTVKEQAGVGAAITAGIGAGVYSGYREAVLKIVKRQSVIVQPDEKRKKVYDRYYDIYRRLYYETRELMHRDSEIS